MNNFKKYLNEGRDVNYPDTKVFDRFLSGKKIHKMKWDGEDQIYLFFEDGKVMTVRSISSPSFINNDNSEPMLDIEIK